jgi:Family of unknown function (DUF5681)
MQCDSDTISLLTHTLTHARGAETGERGRTMDPEKTIPKQRRGGFPPGHSGNPAGRPKGARNRSTVAAESLLEGEAERLTRKAIELALAGDSTALRLCMERLVPPRKDRAIEFALPPLTSADDAGKAIAAIVSAVAEGEITPSEAITVAGLVEACRRTIGTGQPAASLALQVNFVPGGGAGNN